MALTLHLNPAPGAPGIVVLPAAGYRRARRDITGWPGYAPTPLHDLPMLAFAAGIVVLRLKDESARFGLGGVEPLGAGFAVADALLAELARAGIANAATTADLDAHRYDLSRWTLTCAADVHHGRDVAWAAQRFGAQSCIVVPETLSAADTDAVARFGAEIRRLPGADDAAVRAAAAKNWLLIAAAARPGDTEIPRLIMQGVIDRDARPAP